MCGGGGWGGGGGGVTVQAENNEIVLQISRTNWTRRKQLELRLKTSSSKLKKRNQGSRLIYFR